MIDSVEMIRFFTEFTLSRKPRPFASLRVTHGEGFRMTETRIVGGVLKKCWILIYEPPTGKRTNFPYTPPKIKR